MSRYSSRSLDVGSTRYDSSSSSYKGLDASSLGSYRSSNLSGYGSGHSYSSRSEGRGSYGSSATSSSSSTTSSSLGSSGRRAHGSYSSRSSAADSVPLPRSSSFGRSEVLSSSTPRDHVDKGGYSSGLGRSSSIPTHTEETRSGRYSTRSSLLSTNHSLDSGSDAAAERRLRLAERRRQREERGYSETSSDTSKEPSVERASSLRRDSDSDNVMSAARARRLAARVQEASLAEEVTSKDSSPDVGDAALRRSTRRLRGSSGSVEDTVSAVPESRSSLRQRRQLGSSESAGSTMTPEPSVDEKETDKLLPMSAEARRARRQRRLEGLEAASRQGSEGKEEEGGNNSSSSMSSPSTRSWRQRLQEQGVSGVSVGERDDHRRTRRGTSQDEEEHRSQKSADLHGESSDRERNRREEETSQRRHRQGVSEGRSEDSAKAAEEVSTEVESRAERIARYKEERRKQLAHIANITSTSTPEEKEGDVAPFLFTSAKKKEEKEESPGESGVRQSAAPAVATSLTSRLRALRSGSEEADSSVLTPDGQKEADVSMDTPQTSVTAGGKEPKAVSTHQGGEQPMVSTSDSRDGSSASSTSTRQMTLSSRSSPSPSGRSNQTKSSATDSSHQHKPAAVFGASGRKPSTGSRESSPLKTSVTSGEMRSDRKTQDSTAVSRKSKSPSPATSRLMASTKSSAAKEVTTHTSSASSPRSSVSPRNSPAPSGRHNVGRSASDVSGTKGPPRMKPSLMPEHGAKEGSVSHPSKSAAKEGEGRGEAASSDQTSSKHVTRHPQTKLTEGRADGSAGHREKTPPHRQAGKEPHPPRLSSSSFSTTSSSTLSTEKDSGVGSSRLSSSSFSSTRSYDKDTVSSTATNSSTALKAPRLQRAARVELSSSSSREGSEEKQLPATSGHKATSPRSGVQTSVKRTTSMPSKTLSGDGRHSKQSAGPNSETRERKHSSSVEKEPSPPLDLTISQKSRKENAKSEAPGRPGQSPDSPTLSVPAGVSPGSPSGNVALDDLLAKNAEYLSPEEDTSGGSGKERRKLREGEETRVRRSLRRKRSQKSGGGSRSRSRADSAERDSKAKGQKEEMEIEAAATPTVTLPTLAPSHSVVAEGAVLCVCPSPPQLQEVKQTPDTTAATTTTTQQNHTTDAAAIPPSGGHPSGAPPPGEDLSGKDGRGVEGGKEEGEGTGPGSKEATPDSDSVFHTASSAPSSTELPRRRLPDKSELRKSELNKATPGAASHGAGQDKGRKGEAEVSDIRSRFSGGGTSSEKTRSTEGGSKSTGVARHPSRGKEFSQLLSKFSSSSEASSSERSDSEGPQRRRVASFRRPGDKEASSSSDDAQSRATRNIPERSQSLRVVRPSPSREVEKETEEKKVERSGSFKSDFMKRRFSPVPQSDAPSEELSEVLNRRHKETELHLQNQDADLITDTRTARAEHFKTSAIEEVIADSEVASVLRARRKKSESPEDTQDVSQHAPATAQQPRAEPARAARERSSSKEPSPETQAVKAAGQTQVGRERKGSTEEARQSVRDAGHQMADTSHKGHSHQATKESSPSSSARSESSLKSSLTLSMADSTTNKPAEGDTSSARQHVSQGHREELTKEDGSRKSSTSEGAPPHCGTLTLEDRQVTRERSRSAEKETRAPTQPSATTTTTTSSSSTHTGISTAQTSTTESTSASSLRRTESVKQSAPVTRSESFERRKGILKRSPSLPKQELQPVVDPQLMRIMEQRRQKELETAGPTQEDQEEASVPPVRNRALSAAEEIEENIRHMRGGQQSKEGTGAQQSEEEAALCRPVAERIFMMQTKIEEVRHTSASVTPKSRSGAATPRSARSWSGSITPRKQMSVDEGVSGVIPEESTFTVASVPTLATAYSDDDNNSSRDTVEEEMSGLQLMEKLTTLAADKAQYQERRQKFQKRHRDDWRTRTQPVTMDEIHEADSLDTVSAFRAQVRRNASKSVFEQLKSQDQHRPLPSKKSEFPQHLMPEKRGRRARHQRHKTLPVTAEELNAIPEGELLEPVPLRETHELWKRDSRTDSGILSGSEVDSLGSDSLRNLTLEMDVSENDPSRMSVSSKTSLFKSLDERARQEREKEKSASGAKRYIDRKKRERSRTQPVTDDEVKTAAEMSEEKKPPPAVKLPQPEVVNRPKSPSVVDQEAEPEEDDQLTKLSLAEKVKLFSQKHKEEEEAAAAKVPPRTDAPVPKRRQRKLNSRFNTQPVTPEELEKASKISPLAMSLVKPPDPELLMGLKLKDQQELMMMHAEATLSQCSSRGSSRPSSQPGSRRGSFTTPDTLASGEPQEEGGVAATGVFEKGPEKVATTSTSKPQAVGSSHSDLVRTDSEPRGILKKTKSMESVPSDNSAITASKEPPPIIDTTTITTDTITTTTTEPAAVVQSSSAIAQDTRRAEEEEGRASPVPELILPTATEAEVSDNSASMFFLVDEDLEGESSTDPVSAEVVASEDSQDELEARTGDGGKRRKNRASERKGQAERYLTQPAPQLTPERSPQTKRKYEGRHMTQPITPDEMKEAEFSTTPVSGGSIADRLNQLKTSGEENWKKKVVKDKELNTPVLDVKMREKSSLAPVRPLSISDRLCKLETSAEQWKERVEDTDAVKFTVANKLQKSVIGSESPLVAKIKASSKKDLTRLDDSSNASSPVNSPSTPTKEFLPKVPLPKEIVADPAVAEKKAETKEKEKTEAKGVNGDEGEKGEAVRVEVPTVDDEEIEQFFSVKTITDIADKVDVEIDDFDNIFIESNEILQSVKKIRPTRKKKATSRNPLKTVSQFVEIQTEYIQVSSGAAEKQLRKMKAETMKRDAGFAVEALAGLASKENFSKVELRKTEPSSLPAALAARRNPFCDLMLLHVKGRRMTQVRLVDPSGKSMNAGDCFILVTPDKVINWVGEFSNIIEKAKSAEVANYIQQKRDLGYKGTAGAQTVDQAKDHLGSGKLFWSSLKGDKECQACGPDEEDELYESSIIKTNMVYRLEDGALKPYEKYWGAIPKHSMLDKKEVVVFDFGSEFYVWQGKEVSSSQRKLGMSLAQKLWEKGYDYSQCAINPLSPLRPEEEGGSPMEADKRPDWAIFGKVNQNMETILFREKFADWPDSSRLIGVKREKAAEIKCDFADIKAYDAKKMIPVNSSPVTLLLEGAHVGRGKKWQEDMQGFIKEQDILTLGTKVWHVMEYEHYQMPENSYGHFHRGDTYVVRWQYMITNAGLKSLKGQAARQSMTGRERCAYFFWQGQDSTINEKGASALMTVELDEERGPQVRVVQGKEPPCFLNLFEGGMMVHIGKREDASTNTVGPWRLYCVRGDEEGEMCLLEIPVSISNLRSRSSFVLLNTRTGITYVWHGVKSPQHLRLLAVRAVQNLKESRPLELDLHKDAHVVVTEVDEGEEKAEVWSALDSRDRSLYHSLLTDSVRYDYTPRLFHMTSVSLVFEVIEQMNPARLPGVVTPFPFFQSDLYKASQPALFLLDVGHCVYLWQGWWPVGDEEIENVQTGSAVARYNVDRRCAMETTLNYCKERASKGRTPEAFLVCAGVEPLAFQNLFPFWEVDSTVHSLAVQEGKVEGYCECVEDVYIKLTQTRYTLEELQERPLPDGVDPLKLESYLADEEFEEVLEMKRADFYALPAWKQNQMKQTLGLF